MQTGLRRMRTKSLAALSPRSGKTVFGRQRQKAPNCLLSSPSSLQRLEAGPHRPFNLEVFLDRHCAEQRTDHGDAPHAQQHNQKQDGQLLRQANIIENREDRQADAFHNDQ